MSTTTLTASFFDIVPNVNNPPEQPIVIINCQLGTEFPTVSGRAQWGGTQTILCGDTYPVEATTWSKIKATYR